MSNLTQFFGVANLDVAVSSRAPAAGALSGAVKSLQTGYVTGSYSAGSGEDVYYCDITISSVTTSKCLVIYQPLSDNLDSYRLTSATNLRLSTTSASQNPAGRYYVVEFN